MQNDDFITQFEEARKEEDTAHLLNYAARFESIFQRLLSGAHLDLYQESVSTAFEYIAANLLADVPTRKFAWFDGVTALTAEIRKSRQIEFKGQMWVGDDRRKQ